MTKFTKYVLPFVLILGGCSTTYTAETDRNQNYDFSNVSTYYIVGDKHIENRMVSDIDRLRIDNAIEDQFYLNGKDKVEIDSADILVSYFIVTKDKTKVTSTGHHAPYYGYSSRYGHRVGYGYGYGYSNVSTKNYTEGTFVIDLIDNETKETVWRSSLTKPMKNYKTLEERDEAITELIKTMFKELPQL